MATISITDELDQRGFALVRGLFRPGEARQMARGFDSLLHLARTLPGTCELGGSQFVVDRDPFRLRRVVWCGGASPSLGRLGRDPRVLSLAAEALGSDEVVQLIQQAHFKLPGDGVDFAWHQDASNRRYGSDLWTDINGKGSFVQMAIAVDPMGPGNGGLEVIAGSHRQGFVADPVTGALPPGSFDARKKLVPRLEPGDALLFGPFLIHGSGPNMGSVPRRLLIQGFALPGANRRVYPGCGTGVRRHL